MRITRASESLLTPYQAVQAAKDSYDLPPTLVGSGCNQDIHLQLSMVGDLTVLAVRGTATLSNFATDLDALPVDANTAVECKCLPPMHRGVREAVDSVFNRVYLCLHGKPWVGVGHSLGGGIIYALAAEMAAQCEPPQELFLFAPMRAFFGMLPPLLSSVPVQGWRCGFDRVPDLPFYPYAQVPLTKFGFGHPFNWVQDHYLVNFVNHLTPPPEAMP
jgi:hypothetical protein